MAGRAIQTLQAANAPAIRIDFSDDDHALQVWLSIHDESASTHRAYRKEARRFLAWLQTSPRPTLHELTVETLKQYQAFLANPQPRELWCATPVDGQKSLFKGPLHPRSIAYALTVISAWLDFLTEAGYLMRNPMNLMRRGIRRARDSGRSTAMKFLPMSVIQKLFESLERAADAAFDAGNQDDYLAFERMLCVTRLLGNTGVRREELGTIRLSDVFSVRDPVTKELHWLVSVLGKGNKQRNIAFNSTARAACERYYAANNAICGFGSAPGPLIRTLSFSNTANPLSGQTIYKIVKAALQLVGDRLEQEGDADAYLLRAASPHTFRHTFATIGLEMNMGIKFVQEQLRHASIQTTANYQHATGSKLSQAVEIIQL